MTPRRTEFKPGAAGIDAPSRWLVRVNGGRWPGADSHECRADAGQAREGDRPVSVAQALVSQVHIIERSRPLIPTGVKDLVCAHEGLCVSPGDDGVPGPAR